MDKISVNILYEQMKKTIRDATIKAQIESNLPAFLVVAALKEIICKYETDVNADLVKDYQSLLFEITKDKEE